MRICQIEFYSYDVKESLAFGAALLGWKRVPVALQDQAIIEVEADSRYGIAIRKRAGTRPNRAGESEATSTAMTLYFESEKKLSELREACIGLEGKIIQEPTAVTGYGFVMIVEDKGGLRYGLYEAKFEGPRASIPT